LNIVNLTSKSLLEIDNYFRSYINTQNSFHIQLSHIDIDRFGYGSFIDLANSFYLKFLTPVITNEYIILNFEKLNRSNSFHKTISSKEKYGVKSEFFRIDKLSKFSFIHYFKQSLHNAKIEKRKDILNLGVNKGDEFSFIKDILDDDIFNAQNYTGVDFSSSAIKYAKGLFKEDKNINLFCEDINNLTNLKLERFDMIISIGTLQSSTLNLKPLFMDIVQSYASGDGAIILGFPNCRWVDEQMIYGAHVPNYNFSELGTIISDIHFCKKYLQQKKYRVTITGKEYIFLTATKIGV